jgi:integrase
MASIYRRKHYETFNGKKVKKQSTCWYVKYRDPDGIEHRVKGYTDKEATRQMAARLEKEAALASEGVVDRHKEHRSRPLSEHLEDFRQSLRAKGDTPEHVDLTFSRAQKIVQGCGFNTWADISASKAQTYIAGLRDGENGISAQTFNFYLQAFKQFCKWMVQDQRASESPVVHLKRLNVRTDRRHDRRALEVDEVRRLLTATTAARKRFGMTGPQRAMLYRLAVETGLRANELRTLKVSSFDLGGCTVTVQAGYSKHRRQDVLPLRPDTVAELRLFLQGKLPNVQAFKVPDKTANMLKADLADAGIAYVDDSDRYADFHALRHTTGSWLAANGVHPKTIQTIMRHSDINLTMSRYTHTLRGQEAEAVNSLPSLSLPTTEAQKALATGTDGESFQNAIENLQRFAQKSTPKSTPESTPTAFPACPSLSTDGTVEPEKSKSTESRKPFSEGQLDIKRDSFSPHDTYKAALRLEGLGPPTAGSVDRKIPSRIGQNRVLALDRVSLGATVVTENPHE